MKSISNAPELLAPVGTRESLSFAINAGADAVYFGANAFSARQKQEVEHTDIKSIVDYCHLRGIKAYLVMNTLVKQAELDSALNLAATANAAGIDAVIVQDLGLIRLIKQNLKLPIHASTQAGIHNALGAEAMLKLGAERVVLSRETTFKDLVEIKSTGIEVEVFIHGANCVAFSGNCYFSSLCSGFSGNRGRCMQLCRKQYTPYINGKSSKKGYLLSAKDTCGLPVLRRLVEAGVDSFKIEGRLRRAEYIAGAVSIYRKALDNNCKFSSHDLTILAGLFNRGDFVDTRMFGDKELIDAKVQGHVGVKIGTVTFCDGTIFRHDGQRLVKGDGLKILRNGFECANAEVINPDRLTFVGDIRCGDTVMRTTDYQLNKKLLENPQKRIEIEVFCEVLDTKLYLTASKANYKITVSVEGEVSRSNPLTDVELRQVLNKTAEFPFLPNISVGDLGEIFVVKSVLNAARRNLYETLSNAIIAGYNRSDSDNKVCLDNFSNLTSQLDGVSRIINIEEISQLKGYCLKEGDLVSVSPHDFKALKELCISGSCFDSELGLSRERVFLNLPLVACSDDLAILDEVIRFFGGVIVNNPYGFSLAEKYALPFIAGIGLNVANTAACFDTMLASIELNFREIDVLNKPFVYAFGKAALMTLLHCPKKQQGLTCKDCCEKELEFEDKFGKMPLRKVTLSKCYHQLLNSIPIDLSGYGLKRVYIDLVGYNNSDSIFILNSFDCNQPTNLRHTKGHFNRGVV